MIDTPQDEPAGSGVYVRARCDKCGSFANFELPAHVASAWIAYNKIVQIVADYNNSAIGSAGVALATVASVLAGGSGTTK